MGDRPDATRGRAAASVYLTLSGRLAKVKLAAYRPQAGIRRVRAPGEKGSAMKLSLLVGGAVGYVLGAKAGRERYETIVAVARRFAGSQTVQTTAGVLQAQVDTVAQRARESFAARLHAAAPTGGHTANGSRRH